MSTTTATTTATTTTVSTTTATTTTAATTSYNVGPLYATVVGSNCSCVESNRFVVVLVFKSLNPLCQFDSYKCYKTYKIFMTKKV